MTERIGVGVSRFGTVPAESLQFELGALYRSIDQARLDHRLSWAALAGRCGVAASTIRRFERAADAEADGVLALIGWLGVPPERFVTGAIVAGEPLPPAGGGVVRVDMSLLGTASREHRASTRAGDRTSIQHLVTVAQTAGRTVASLTRCSEA